MNDDLIALQDCASASVMRDPEVDKSSNRDAWPVKSTAATSSASLSATMSALSFRHRHRRKSDGALSPFQRHPRHSDLVSQRIVRKYRRMAREMEYKRLRLIVPAVANKDRASKVFYPSFIQYFHDAMFVVCRLRLRSWRRPSSTSTVCTGGWWTTYTSAAFLPCSDTLPAAGRRHNNDNNRSSSSS